MALLEYAPSVYLGYHGHSASAGRVAPHANVHTTCPRFAASGREDSWGSARKGSLHGPPLPTATSKPRERLGLGATIHSGSAGEQSLPRATTSARTRWSGREERTGRVCSMLRFAWTAPDRFSVAHSRQLPSFALRFSHSGGALSLTSTAHHQALPHIRRTRGRTRHTRIPASSPTQRRALARADTQRPHPNSTKSLTAPAQAPRASDSSTLTEQSGKHPGAPRCAGTPPGRH